MAEDVNAIQARQLGSYTDDDMRRDILLIARILAELQSRIEALEASIVDHETRITALETP